ncbi:Uncharacterized protein, PA2063/DUF2235 family [Mariprofundus aestuarium]|uniref:Uncharacterized protein, PA2063/DUF2235 family n=1 Tax=Mariprofundus aestuarium TaxID=1921086 RepID=A0A2K8KYQ3_MARES|nr:DUF2235 domain-containing protein [Mariprofundus aestuarium]ATX79029.1 Uncharacterized protein, PA2063/DUF2235 family [Mariprofundus aestuarium]
MPKNIVVFSDGTGQEGGKGNNTNVYRLFNMVEDRTPNQVAFYDRGLGTGWRKVTGSGAGLGISKNIMECYEFIFDHYQAGDRIYLFGFSRGAYTVRSLSGFINLFGILPKSRPELIEEAYKIYKTKECEEQKKKAEKFLSKHHNQYCEIEFIGVWDTVGALGVPIKAVDMAVDWIPGLGHSFHNTALSDNVKYGCHALSIDDERLTFHPTFWDERALKGHQKIEQVWFPGVHTDVGGGYEHDGLSGITLEWMVKKATAQGLLIYPKHKVVIKPDSTDWAHNSRAGMASLFRKKQRDFGINGEIIKPVIHQSVLDRKLNRVFGQGGDPEAYEPWILQHDYDVEPWDG